MFRTKTKKKTGAATRKRKDLDDGDENDEQILGDQKAEPMEVDEGEAPNEKDLADVENDPLGVGDGGEEDEDAMLARMRNRIQKNQSKAGSAMIFSSKANGAKKNTRMRVHVEDDENQDADMSATTSAATAGGCLSFEEEVAKPSKKGSKKMRIRPNLSAAQPNEDGDEEDASTAAMYSQDMLASLLREQKVLLRRAPPSSEVHEIAGDAMEVEEGSIYAGEDEETKGESADEEFIPLNAKMMQAKKNKKRVTFGVQHEEYYPPKTAEVEEPVATSDVEDDEGVQSKRWEEELMRRGGGHHMPTSQSQATRYDLKATYPTRKNVPCASLGEVMRSIQRKIDAGSIERDRVARELARLDAESELIQKKLQQQRDELLVSSEQYEYFQVVEDFVKGLSFCLREKLPSIDTAEQTRTRQWTASRATLKEQREADIRDEIGLCLGRSAIQDRQFVNLPSDVGNADGPDAGADARLARLKKRYEDVFEPESAAWDVFADAVDDIKSIDRVYGRFQEWKNKFPDIYKDSYANLALSKLYAPYIRVELINWDPLAVSMGGIGVSGFPCRVSEMAWFKVLVQHQSLQRPQIDEPVSSLLRDIVINRVVDGTKTRFDAFSPVHTQSIVDLIEDLIQLNAVPHVEHGLDEIVGNVVASLTSEAKHLPLLAVDEQEAMNDRTRFFAAFLVGEFCGLLENALTLFVALPNGHLHERGFNAVMQILHHLLAYVTRCRHLHKTATQPQIQRTVQQLSSSSFMQSLLSRSTREQLEFQRIVQLLNA
jgi:hypothetical protein